MSIYNTHMEINGVEDVPISVHYVHCRSISGSRDGPGGLKIEPDEPEHIEIEMVEGPNGEITLTQNQERAMEEEIGDWLTGYYDQEPPEGEDV